MFLSNTKFYIKETISVSAGASDTFEISTDLELSGDIDTGGEQVSIVLKNDSQIERMIVTITSGVATIVKRGLTQDDTDIESEGLKKQWSDGDIGYITALAFDLSSLNGDNTFSGDNTFETDTTFEGNLDLSDTKGNVWDTDFYVKRSGNDLLFRDKNQAEIALSTLASLSGSNDKTKVSADDTTEGYLNGKLTGGDGITLTETTPGGNETLDIDIDLTDTNKFATDGTASRAVVTDGSGNIFQATETVRGGVELPTDAEMSTGTDTNKTPTVKQVKDFTIPTTFQASVDSSSPTTTVIAHGLGRTPRFLRTIGGTTTNVCHGTFDGTNSKSILLNAGGNTFLSASAIRIQEPSGGDYVDGVITWDATNVTITWSTYGTPTGAGKVQIEVI